MGGERETVKGTEILATHGLSQAVEKPVHCLINVVHVNFFHARSRLPTRRPFLGVTTARYKYGERIYRLLFSMRRRHQLPEYKVESGSRIAHTRRKCADHFEGLGHEVEVVTQCREGVAYR